MATPERWDEFVKRALEWRGIEEPCKACGGCGNLGYGSTATWRGGAGGQAITQDVCNKCWGSGDAHRSGVNRRELDALVRRMKQLEDRIVEMWHANRAKNGTLAQALHMSEERYAEWVKTGR